MDELQEFHHWPQNTRLMYQLELSYEIRHTCAYISNHLNSLLENADYHYHFN